MARRTTMRPLGDRLRRLPRSRPRSLAITAIKRVAQRLPPARGSESLGRLPHAEAGDVGRTLRLGTSCLSVLI